jgi:hypothetical protein
VGLLRHLVSASSSEGVPINFLGLFLEDIRAWDRFGRSHQVWLKEGRSGAHDAEGLLHVSGPLDADARELSIEFGRISSEGIPKDLVPSEEIPQEHRSNRVWEGPWSFRIPLKP